MYRLFPPSVASVTSAPVLVIFIDEEQSGWCQQASREMFFLSGQAISWLDLSYQFSEEGYAVLQVAHHRDTNTEQDHSTVAHETLGAVRKLGCSWAIVTYGITQEDANFISNFLDATSRAPNLKACIHFTISCKIPTEFIPRTSVGRVLP